MTGALTHSKALRRFMAKQRRHRAHLRRLNAVDQVARFAFPRTFTVRCKPEECI
jgi:hypothetical protein